MLFLMLCSFGVDKSIAAHGVSLYGDLKYGPDFQHFDYVNPDAPKGGRINFAVIGTFDSLNPFIIKGDPAAGMSPLHASNFYATLLDHSADEPIAAYGYIAEDVEVAPDRASVTFTLRKNATFHDGSPIIPEDVVFTFNMLKEKGQPFYKAYYREITTAETVGSHKVKFTFQDGNNKELPIIISEMPILSKTFYQEPGHEFDDASMKHPLGSGPYKIEKVSPGKSITYKRVENWWGKDLPVNKGEYNIDVLKYVYFRDPTVAFQSLQAGVTDFRLENIAKNWAKAYTFPAVESGDVKKLAVKHQGGAGMQGMAFNTRREIFKDPRVRKAISLLFDFEWANKNLFYGLYKRTNSYFANSELASRGIPKGRELEILKAFEDQLPQEVFIKPFRMPVTDGSGNIRAQLRQAIGLLKEAGWKVKNHKLVHKKTNQLFKFEILLVQPDLKRVLNGFIRNLKRLGIDARLRVVDSSQYMARIDEFDFDMISIRIGQSESPGNEQFEFWGSKVAGVKGSRNYMGIASPIVDALIQEVIDAPTRDELVNRTRALDRVLLHQYYVVPMYHSDEYLFAHWRHFKHPKKFPKYTLQLSTWWVDCNDCKELAEKYQRPQLTKHCKVERARALAER